MPLETGILITKLYRPRISGDLVSRPRLVEQPGSAAYPHLRPGRLRQDNPGEQLAGGVRPARAWLL
jgi:hypothetical protein